MSDRDFAEGVHRSAEFMRLHEDEPNESYPPNHTCEACGDRKLTRADAREGEGVVRCPDCDCWYCETGCITASGRCKECEVMAEAERLEAEVAATAAAELRALQLGNPISVFLEEAK